MAAADGERLAVLVNVNLLGQEPGRVCEAGRKHPEGARRAPLQQMA